jgi:hypothetical protein
LDAGRAFSETLMRMKHRHGDSWYEMSEIEERRDSTENDAERRWGNRRIYRCTACEEDIMIDSGPESVEPPR